MGIPSRIRNKILEERKCCEKCGSTFGLEVHHIVPRALGGNDSEDNLRLLCEDCHRAEHRLNRGELTKKGIEKIRKTPSIKYINLKSFYEELNEILKDNYVPSLSEVLDIIEKVPYRTYKEDNK